MYRATAPEGRRPPKVLAGCGNSAGPSGGDSGDGLAVAEWTVVLCCAGDDAAAGRKACATASVARSTNSCRIPKLSASGTGFSPAADEHAPGGCILVDAASASRKLLHAATHQHFAARKKLAGVG
jgi:hypothetical protein